MRLKKRNITQMLLVIVSSMLICVNWCWSLKWLATKHTLCCKVFKYYKVVCVINNMSDKINLKKMEQNAYKLLNQDGLMELLMGTILFVMSSTFGGASSLASFLALYVIFIRQIVEGFKKRYTYPRIGYLKLPEDDSKQIGIGIFTYMGVALLGLLAFIYLIYGGVTGDLLYKWLPLLIGLIFFGGLQYHYGKSGDKLALLYIAIAVGAGLIFSLWDFPEKLIGVQFYTLFMSAVFIVIGALRFRKFRNDYPVQPIPEGAPKNE